MDLEKAHGRLEQRPISVPTPLKRLVNYPGVSPIARVIRYREFLKKDGNDGGNDDTEIAWFIAFLDAVAASPEDLFRLKRGHRAVENINPPKKLRLRRGRLPDPHGPQPGELANSTTSRSRWSSPTAARR